MNNYLDTILSLVFIFFIFSIIAYIFQELLAVNMEYRGRLLWKSIAQLLDGFRPGGKEIGKNKLKLGDAPYTDALFGHPQIYTLRKTPTSYPSYIPAANFALAVMDLVAKEAPDDKKTGDLFTNIKLGIEKTSTKLNRIIAKAVIKTEKTRKAYSPCWKIWGLLQKISPNCKIKLNPGSMNTCSG